MLDVDETAGALLARASADDPAAGAEFSPALRVSADGSRAWIEPEPATSLFYADCPPDGAEFAQRCTAVVPVNTGHSPFLSAPDLVAGVIGDYL
ncbi:MAG TPA: hypothetical protein VHW44_01450 [Pseudonocardiaceae bacterium]|jgi:hypothetical protein|nr:hypothetical protein [Pseudonocardiaceae bacterium]